MVDFVKKEMDSVLLQITLEKKAAMQSSSKLEGSKRVFKTPPKALTNRANSPKMEFRNGVTYLKLTLEDVSESKIA